MKKTRAYWQEDFDTDFQKFCEIPFTEWSSQKNLANENKVASIKNYIEFIEEKGKHNHLRPYLEAKLNLWRAVSTPKIIAKNAVELFKYASDWIRICYATDDKNINFYFLTRESPINREQHVRDAFFCKFNGANGEIEPFLESKEGKIYGNVLTDWFLRRYDLLTAWKIDAALNPSRLLKQLSRHTINGLMLFLFMVIVFCGASLYAGHFNMGYALFNFQPLFTSSNPPLDPKLVIFNNLFSIPVGVFYFLAACMAFMGIQRIRLFLPRLVGSLLIGFFPLITSKDFWTLSQNMNWWQVTVLTLLAYVVAFFYLRFEIHNLVRSNTPVVDKPGDKDMPVLTARELTKRAVCVTLISILYSFGIAVLVNDLIGAFLIEICESAAVEVALCGILGLIYPKTVLLLSGFALVLGIFVQIIWQKNTITEPL